MSYYAKGRRNIYTCEKCGHHVVTYDRDAGVTPFMISCEVCEKIVSKVDIGDE